MKKLFFLCLFTALSGSTLYAGEQRAVKKSACCNSGKICYSILSRLLPNDYLYLADSGSEWFLKHKLENREDFEDRDRYWPRFMVCYQGSDKRMISFYTPLHAAILFGRVKCIELLLSSGADKNKKIKCVDNIEGYNIPRLPEDAAKTKSYCSLDRVSAKLNRTYEEEQRYSFIGLSGVSLAKRLADEEVTLNVSKETRTEIYNLLKKKKKKKK